MESIDIFSWYALKLVLWAGPFGIAAFLAAIAGAAFYAGYLAGRRKPREIAMSHQMPIHGKTDILPDGTNTPLDIFN